MVCPIAALCHIRRMDRDEPRYLWQRADRPAWRHWAALAKCSPDTALRDINELRASCIGCRAEAGVPPTR